MPHICNWHFNSLIKAKKGKISFFLHQLIQMKHTAIFVQHRYRKEIPALSPEWLVYKIINSHYKSQNNGTRLKVTQTYLLWVTVDSHHTLTEPIKSILTVRINVNGLLVCILGLRKLFQPLVDLPFPNISLHCKEEDQFLTYTDSEKKIVAVNFFT